jgi:hypothetical protein
MCACAALAGCSKRETPTVASDVQQPSGDPAPPAAPIEACSLLTSEEIAAVQGEPLQETKASQRADAGLAMSECYFTLPTFTSAISLSVGQRGVGPSAREPERYWAEIFNETVLRGSEKSPPPLKIEGLGDSAYWTGNERLGAVHVLKGRHYLRISVGGPGDAEAKINRCRALLEAVMKRL